ITGCRNSDVVLCRSVHLILEIKQAESRNPKAFAQALREIVPQCLVVDLLSHPFLIVLQLLLRVALHSIQFVSGGALSQTLENQLLSSSEVRLQPFGGDDSRCFEPFNQIPQPPSCTRESLRQIVPID